MNELGKFLALIGGILLVAGAAVLLLGKLHIPIGKLPGDVAWRSKSGNTTVYFPLATCIIVSLLLSLIMWAVNHFRR